MIKRLILPEIQKNFDATGELRDYFFPPKGEQPKIMHPYRISSYGLGLYHEGSVALTADLKAYEIGPRSLLILPPNVIREWTFRDTASPVNSTLFFLKDFILKELSNTDLFDDLGFLKSKKVETFRLNENEYERLTQAFGDVLMTSEKASPHRARLISLKLASLLYQIDEMCQNREPVDDAAISRPQVLVNQFIDLVNQHFIAERNVSFYANQLFISPKYLSQIVAEKTGQKALAFIRDRIILEAKVLLQNKEKSISEVSYVLRFSSPTQFGKYFKKYSGMSPGTFRKQAVG
jgi:AraC-like DNA-binding protein